MLPYLLRRTLLLAASLLLASAVLFVLLRLLPGDPANALLSVGATPEQIAAVRREIGSDRPLTEQFLSWLGRMAVLDLGSSFVSDLPVGPEISARLVVTVPLTLLAFTVSLLVAVPVGFVAAHRPRSWYGALLNGVSQLGVAVPVFWIGMLLATVFSLHLRWLPAGGFPQDDWADPVGALASLALPVATVALVMSASLIRYVRSAALDVLDSDYLRTARALGCSLPGAMWRHGLRNAAVPVVSVLGLELATTFLGAVVVESVFALPGLGSMLVRAFAQHDYPVIQGVLVVGTLAVLLAGLLADTAQRIIDPRLRDTAGGGRW
ncbi:peptide ABC transporter [Planomonospora sphaerica]|uniref:Peptide ABC transporter n=1 Tax=Planomonospora sphaerica TaxID=161355 RepID=A0A171DQD5_9ACTN|nr:ABC transporter permease [Planomonospora sphaerica]GAT71276.1 peptide ABC transporter [Planomonospora sphaerica]